MLASSHSPVLGYETLRDHRRTTMSRINRHPRSNRARTICIAVFNQLRRKFSDDGPSKRRVPAAGKKDLRPTEVGQRFIFREIVSLDNPSLPPGKNSTAGILSVTRPRDTFSSLPSGQSSACILDGHVTPECC